MEYKAHEVKAGIVVFVAFVLLFAFIFSITKAGFKKDVKYYTARFSYTNGIQKGSLVRLGGMLVGRIESVYFPAEDNTQIEVLLKVDASAPVRSNSVAYITSIGLMGDYYVEISTGTSDAPLLPSGSRLNSKDVPTFSQMGEPLQRVSTQLEDFLGQLNQLMNQENQEHIGNVIASVDTILQNSQTKASSLLGHLSDLTVELKELTNRLDQLMEQNSNSFSDALVRFNSSMTRAESLLVALSNATTHINYIVATNETNLYEALQHFQEASRNFEEFSRQIKYQPWSLIRKSSLPKRKIPKQ
ncbi:MAG: MCE family protein [Calditrichaeota bacterium]|nr:MAG: MCE family protein [Calditrichota bacterium]